MIKLEKLLFLKTITLFKQLPDDLLLHMINFVVKEATIPANDLIIKQGEQNNNIYIIVSGKVRVHHNNVIVTELIEREIFGEISALTTDPAISSVSTLTDCFLLKINKHELFDLINIEPIVSLGIIQELCKRTQDMSLQIQDLLEKQWRASLD